MTMILADSRGSRARAAASPTLLQTATEVLLLRMRRRQFNGLLEVARRDGEIAVLPMQFTDGGA